MRCVPWVVVCVRGLQVTGDWEADSSRGVQPLRLPIAPTVLERQPGIAADMAPNVVLLPRAQPTPGTPHPRARPQSLWLSSLNKLGSFVSQPALLWVCEEVARW